MLHALIAALALVQVASANTGLDGAPAVRISAYECLPPVPLRKFRLKLQMGEVDTGLDMTEIDSLQASPQTRLLFQSVTGIGGRLDLLDERGFDVLPVKTLTTSRVQEAGVELFALTPASSGSRYANLFSPMLEAHTVILTRNDFGLMLAPDKAHLSLCVRQRSQWARRVNVDWRLDKDVLDSFNRTQAKAFLSTTLRDGRVWEMLRCENLLAPRT